MKLENWSIVSVNFSPYTPPELLPKALHGLVYGNPKFADGEEVTTTPIAGVRDGKAVTRSGSVYELGTVNPNYEAQYPGARERFLGSDW